MVDLVLRGLEHVYDAFDEYEHPNDITLLVSGMSLDMAIASGVTLLQDMVLRDRHAGGYMATGTFVAELLCIEDSDGFIHYQSPVAAPKGLRRFGGDLEDYRCAFGSLMFLSYSHRDSEFVNKLSLDIARRGFQTWMDHNDIGIEEELVNSGRPTSLRPELKEVLARAVTRANRLLLIVSEHSVKSEWVQVEVGFALAKGQRDRVPIDHLIIDDCATQKWPPWMAATKSSNIFDFSRWRDLKAYGETLKALLEINYIYKGI